MNQILEQSWNIRHCAGCRFYRMQQKQSRLPKLSAGRTCLRRGDLPHRCGRRIHPHYERKIPEMLVGAGTMLTIEQADCAVKAGAKFIVSPGLNPEGKMVPGTRSTSDPGHRGTYD